MATLKVGDRVFFCVDAGDAAHGVARKVVPAIVVDNINALHDEDIRKLSADDKKKLAADPRFKTNGIPHSGTWADLFVIDPATKADFHDQVYFGRDVGEFDLNP